MVLAIFAFLVLPALAALALWVLHLHRRVQVFGELLANEAEHTRGVELALRHTATWDAAEPTGRHIYDPSR